MLVKKDVDHHKISRILSIRRCSLLKKQSKKTRRQAEILDALKLDPTKRVHELARDLDVSPETIRRDLAELDAEGSIRRTYGGAVRAGTFEPALAERLKLYIRERERIAKRIVDLLDGVENLYIGGGATTLHFARALKSAERHMTILTASFEIALELATNPLFDVISLPGTVELQEGLVHGPETLRFIEQYNVQATVMGASAADEIGISEALPSAADVYSAMIRQAERTFVAADSSKVGKTSLKRVLKWNAQTTLVTDAAPPPAFSRVLGGLGADIIVAAASD